VGVEDGSVIAHLGFGPTDWAIGKNVVLVPNVAVCEQPGSRSPNCFGNRNGGTGVKAMKSVN